MKRFHLSHLPIILITLLLSGCVSGPYWKKNFVAQSIPRNNQVYNEVIVSDFLSAERMSTSIGSPSYPGRTGFSVSFDLSDEVVFDMSDQIALAYPLGDPTPLLI